MIACIDIGGTHTRVAISNDGKTFASRSDFPTPPKPEEGIEQIAKALEQAKKKNIKAIVIGVPGALTPDGTVISSPNLSGWNGFNIAAGCKKRIGILPQVINDALLAALGEAVHGAGRDYHRVGFITVSTGIGGGLIVNRKPHSVAHGFEPGRQIIDIQNHITLQDLASGAGVRKETGKAPKETLDPVFWEGKAKILAVGLWNTIIHWSPEILVVGGPMVLGNPKIDLEQTVSYLKVIAHAEVPLPKIVPAILKDDAGLVGGLAAVAVHPAHSHPRQLLKLRL